MTADRPVAALTTDIAAVLAEHISDGAIARVAAAVAARLAERDREVVTRDGYVAPFNAQSDAEAKAYKAGWADALAEVRDEESVIAARLAERGNEEQHTRTQTNGGPDFCKECSAAAQEWVEWPCSRDRLVAAVRANESLHQSYERGNETTEVEWGVRCTLAPDKCPNCPSRLGAPHPSEQSARQFADDCGDMAVVRRERVRTPDRVTEWTEVYL
jgi:hypothetical protein